MLSRTIIFLSLAGFTLVLSAPVSAYVGPGAGITMLGALWGIIAALLIALFGLVLLPLRIYLRRKRQRLGSDISKANEGETGPGKSNSDDL